jgi:hypothetical protein
MSRAEVHAELGEIIVGRKPGRTSDDEIIVFDSTGTARAPAFHSMPDFMEVCSCATSSHPFSAVPGS